MKKAIKDIAQIRTGLFAKPAGVGELVYLQAKHFDEHGQLQAALYPDLIAEGISEKHLLKEGDILFSAKGSKNFATVFEKYHQPAVASTSFFVIRLVNKKLLPHYLAWLLNSQTIQSLLKSQAIGTSIPSISKKSLEYLEILVPSVEIQKIIMQIARLRNREKLLKLEIDKLREQQIQHIIYNTIKQLS